MNVKIKVFAGLRDFMPREENVDVAGGTTVSVLLERLCGKYKGLYEELFDSPGQLKPYVNVLKNGRNVFFIGDMGTVLEDGDVLAIFPPIAGG